MENVERRVTPINCNCPSNPWRSLRLERDPKVAKAGIQVRTGRKWRAEVAVQEAAARMRQSMVGVVTQGIAGLG